MAKPKTKLPKVWLTFLDGSIQPWNWHAKKPSNENGLVSRLYAPVQPPRRCVWESVGMNAYRRNCNNQVWPWRGDFEGGHCPGCGGKIRRKS